MTSSNGSSGRLFRKHGGEEVVLRRAFLREDDFMMMMVVDDESRILKPGGAEIGNKSWVKHDWLVRFGEILCTSAAAQGAPGPQIETHAQVHI